MKESENITLFTKGEAVTLYSIFRANLLGSINLHREHSQHYLMFVAAIIAATIAGLSQIDRLGEYGILLLMGPLLNITICFLAVRMADRFYKGFLEEVTIAAKLEDIIGLTAPRKIEDQICFKEDISIVPSRWIIDRSKYNGVEEFVSSFMNSGANFVNRLTFVCVGLINIGALCYIVYVILKSK